MEENTMEYSIDQSSQHATNDRSNQNDSQAEHKKIVITDSESISVSSIDRIQMNEASKKRKAWEHIAVVPLILIIAIVPILVRAEKVHLSEEIFRFWGNQDYYEYYHYIKAKAILLIDILLILGLIFMCITQKKQFIDRTKKTKWMLMGLGIFSVLAIMSAMRSSYPELAYYGAPERCEGLWIVLSYILISIYGIFVVKEESLRYLKGAFLFLGIIISVLSIGNLTGKNFLFDSWLKHFTLLKDMTISFTQDHRTFWSLTFYNPNYTGSYCAMMIPLLFAWTMDAKENKIIRSMTGVLFLSHIGILFFSRSQAGMVGVLLAVLIAFYYYSPLLFRYQTLSLGLGVWLIFMVLAGNFFTGGKLLNEVNDIFAGAKRMISSNAEYVHDPTYGAYIYDVQFPDKDVIRLVTLDGNIDVLTGGNDFGIVDSEGKTLLERFDTDSGYAILKKPYDDVALKADVQKPENKITIMIVHQNKIVFMAIKEIGGESYLTVNASHQRFDMVQAPHWGFEGKEKLGSGRGYIWSRTIPLLKNALLIGYGPDNFLVMFPQGDYLAKSAISDTVLLVVDKPHNTYLLWMVSEGVVATLALILSFVIFVVIVIRSLKRKERYTTREHWMIGCLMAVISYLGAGFFNDSAISVAPIFWAVLGIGMILPALSDEKQTVNTQESIR